MSTLRRIMTHMRRFRSNLKSDTSFSLSLRDNRGVGHSSTQGKGRQRGRREIMGEREAGQRGARTSTEDGSVRLNEGSSAVGPPREAKTGEKRQGKEKK